MPFNKKINFLEFKFGQWSQRFQWALSSSPKVLRDPFHHYPIKKSVENVFQGRSHFSISVAYKLQLYIT